MEARIAVVLSRWILLIQISSLNQKLMTCLVLFFYIVFHFHIDKYNYLEYENIKTKFKASSY